MLHVVGSIVDGLLRTVLMYAGVFLLICVVLCVGWVCMRGYMLPYVMDMVVIGGISIALVSLW
jgi:hypothetical protein